MSRVLCWIFGHDVTHTSRNPNPLCHRCRRRFDVDGDRGWF
jgi:hypothetical protein